MTNAYIAATGIAVPPAVPTERFLEIDQKYRARHGQSREVRDMIRQFVENAQIKQRHSVCSGWFLPGTNSEGYEDIFTEYDYDPPAYLRARYWHEQAPKMAIQAAQNMLAHWSGSVADITHVVTTSTSGWAEPGIAVELIEALGLSEDTRKIEININGCFCGASCLRTARDIIRGGEAKNVLVVATELASIQYNMLETDVSQLISSSLFADGAAAAIVSAENSKGAWAFDKAGMSLVPGSKHMLKLNPDFEKEATAVKMFLHQGVSKALAGYFQSGRGRGLLDDILKDAPSYPALAVHPGGPNILDGMNGVLLERGWPKNCLDASYATLHETGNLGSAAVLFVLDRLMRETENRKMAYFAFGPGVTVEWGSLSSV